MMFVPFLTPLPTTQATLSGMESVTRGTEAIGRELETVMELLNRTAAEQSTGSSRPPASKKACVCVYVSMWGSCGGFGGIDDPMERLLLYIIISFYEYPFLLKLKISLSFNPSRSYHSFSSLPE